MLSHRSRVRRAILAQGGSSRTCRAFNEKVVARRRGLPIPRSAASVEVDFDRRRRRCGATSAAPTGAQRRWMVRPAPQAIAWRRADRRTIAPIIDTRSGSTGSPGVAAPPAQWLDDFEQRLRCAARGYCIASGG
jgi:hypothetical protein